MLLTDARPTGSDCRQCLRHGATLVRITPDRAQHLVQLVFHLDDPVVLSQPLFIGFFAELLNLIGLIVATYINGNAMAELLIRMHVRRGRSKRAFNGLGLPTFLVSQDLLWLGLVEHYPLVGKEVERVHVRLLPSRTIHFETILLFPESAATPHGFAGFATAPKH